MARRGTTVDGHAAQVVEANDRLRPEHDARSGEGAQRYHVSAGVAHVDAEDIIDTAAIDRFALHVDLPGAAEQVEIVDVGAAEHRLQRIEDGGNVDAERL